MSEKNLFENLNFEKPSKTFLDIAKSIAKPDDIGVINDDNGQVFNTKEARSVYITNFYSNLYRKDDWVEGTIEDFLGPEICADPVVGLPSTGKH
jgi:hypothetical protein